MARFETWLTSDLKQMVRVQPLSGVIFTADNAGNLIGVEVLDNGQPASLSGGVTGWAIRSDGATVMITGTLSGNKASIVLPASAYVVPGAISFVIKVGTTTVGACTGYVYQSSTDEIVDPGHVVPSLAELLAHIQETIQAAAAANTAATNANTKASAADTAATNANTAAANANAKASAADTAATSANTAAANANDKASAANTAATNANNKASAADTAATNANNKASAANTAASAANTAATNANDKASAANTAATNANTQASAAQSAASAANSAAAKIDGMTVAATRLSAGSAPTATISDDPTDGHKHILFGLVQGDKGNPGKDFHIAKTFTSIAQMEAYSGTDIEAYDFVMIDTGSVQDPDTGKLYCYEPEKTSKWQYIGDLSGAQGIKGETGTGIASAQLNSDYTLTLTFTDGTTYTTGSIRGAQGETGQASYVHIRYSTNQPTQDEDMHTTPDNWMGIYSGPASIGPGVYFAYTWYKIKGEQGSIENVYGNTIPMSSTDSTKVSEAIEAAQDVFEYASQSGFPATGEAEKLYLAKDTNIIYRWDTNEYIAIGGDISGKADKSDTVLDTTLSRGRKASTTIGAGSLAFGNNVTASGNYSQAVGYNSISNGNYSHAEGNSTANGSYSHSEGKGTADGMYSHAEGFSTKAYGSHSHAEGIGSIAYASQSHAEGNYTQAPNTSSHVFGSHNAPVPYASEYPAYSASTSYHIGDRVSYNGYGYVYISDISGINKNPSMYPTYWQQVGGALSNIKHFEEVGNGSSSAKKNIRALDSNGNEYLAGDVYVHSNDAGTSGTKVATETAMTGATSSTAGTMGLVPAPAAGDEEKYLRGDGTWAEAAGGNSTLRDIPFSFALTDWTEVSVSGQPTVYTAQLLSQYITSTSKDIAIFDTSLLDNVQDSIVIFKRPNGDGVTFQTETMPTGVVSGRLFAIDPDDGKVPVLIEDTVVSIANGGTGASTVSGAKTALGIPTVEDSLTSTSTTNALSAAKGKELADDLSEIDAKVTDFFIEREAATSHDFTLSDAGSCILAISTSGGSRSWVGYIFRASSSGGLTVLEMAKGTNASYTTSGGTLTVSFGASVPAHARVIYIHGVKLQ